MQAAIIFRSSQSRRSLAQGRPAAHAPTSRPPYPTPGQSNAVGRPICWPADPFPAPAGERARSQKRCRYLSLYSSVRCQDACWLTANIRDESPPEADPRCAAWLSEPLSYKMQQSDTDTASLCRPCISAENTQDSHCSLAICSDIFWKDNHSLTAHFKEPCAPGFFLVSEQP